VRICRPALTVRGRLVLGTLMVGLAFPASSAATAPDQIITKAIRNGGLGFKLTLSIYEGSRKIPNRINAILFRHTPKGTENDNYLFSGGAGHPLRFITGTRPLDFARITGRFADREGSIDLTFHATGPARHVTVPRGCTGHGGERRPGTLSGSFRLRADNLGTVRQESFQASISSASFVCNERAHGYELQTSGVTPAGVDVFKERTGLVSERFDVLGGGNGWQVDHSYTVSGLPPYDYTFNRSKLNRGHVFGGGGISGAATYSSRQSNAQHTIGWLRGSLAVRFASIGRVNALRGSRRARQSHS
jgi:hypothetical protein